jgi:hypothetical protein
MLCEVVAPKWQRGNPLIIGLVHVSQTKGWIINLRLLTTKPLFRYKSETMHLLTHAMFIIA